MWIGKKSKKQSLHTQSVMNYREISTAMEPLLQKYGSQFSKRTTFLFENRIEDLRERNDWGYFKGHFRNGQFGTCLLYLRRKYVRYRAFEVIRRKFGWPERYWLSVSGKDRAQTGVRDWLSFNRRRYYRRISADLTAGRQKRVSNSWFLFQISVELTSIDERSILAVIFNSLQLMGVYVSTCSRA